ncbi:Trm112 family protein [Pseudodesulfovibrio sp.]|nr:Trm112 family protein [Pseudodesulfovibrio sp.]
MALKKELIDILACPQCKGKLIVQPAEDGLACAKCAVVYPVKDEIPIMLVDQAIPVKDWTGSK